MHEPRGPPLECPLAGREAAYKAMLRLPCKGLRWRTNCRGRGADRIIAAGAIIAAPAKELSGIHSQPLAKRCVGENDLAGGIKRRERRRRILQASQQRSAGREWAGHGWREIASAKRRAKAPL